MGNMLPCLVQGRTTLPAAMNPKQRFYSLKLLVKALHKMKKKMMKPCSSSSSKGDKIGGSKSSSPAPTTTSGAASATAAAGGGAAAAGMGSKPPRVSPRRAAQGGHRKGVVRVKVVLTKEEAARLLSLTVGAGAGAGRKTAAQIVAEIKRMEARRAFASTAAAWRPALESIPEEHHHSPPRRGLDVQAAAA
ncbi:uncharacterized protein LOC102714248 [Oryza brachyantha]|uniref:uncharacterized protein LOC102714248 n=1 Tax=Oryza brachyantha TaxID=4533 RepID=UPI001ADD3F7B|nr:uncharacterized protein LOC102714248 [Oryza brachyantha]